MSFAAIQRALTLVLFGCTELAMHFVTRVTPIDDINGTESHTENGTEKQPL